MAAAKRDLARAILDGQVTRAAAAKELRVSAEAIRRWVAAERERSRPFVAVEVTEASEGAGRAAEVVEIAVAGGRRLRVSSGIEAADLVRLVRALESC